jgi:hypothetical protein
MFKIAFPWAKADEEKVERDYLKAREYTSEEEVAGNVWISPSFGRLSQVALSTTQVLT